MLRAGRGAGRLSPTGTPWDVLQLYLEWTTNYLEANLQWLIADKVTAKDMQKHSPGALGLALSHDMQFFEGPLGLRIGRVIGGIAEWVKSKGVVKWNAPVRRSRPKKKRK